MPDKPKLIIPSYPWAAPSEEQKRMFDALSYEEQLNMLREALIADEKSGISNKSFDEIREEARAEMKVKSPK